MLDQLSEEYAPNGIVSSDQASELAAEVCFAAMVTTNNMIAVGKAGDLPGEDDISAWDTERFVAGAVDLLQARDGAELHHIGQFVAEECFREHAPASALEDEAAQLMLGRAHFIGVQLRRRLPTLAKRLAESPSVPRVSERVPPASAHLGQTLTADIHSRLLIDELWTVRTAREMSWVGHRLRQTIHTSRTFMSREIPVTCISVATTVVRGIQGSREHVERALTLLNAFAVGSGYQFLPDRAEIIAFAKQTVHSETLEWRAEEMAAYAIIQLAQAEAEADNLAALTQGEVAVWIHPFNGARSDVDEMLGIIPKHFSPLGRGPSLFDDLSEMELATELIDGTACVCTHASARGLTVAAPFGEDDFALIQITAEATHPMLGSGLAVASQVVFDWNEPELVAIAAQLQAAQAGTQLGGSQLGGWGLRHMGDVPFVAFCRFVPNALYRSGLLRDVLQNEMNRMEWLHERTFPGVFPSHVRDILLARGLLPP